MNPLRIAAFALAVASLPVRADEPPAPQTPAPAPAAAPAPTNAPAAAPAPVVPAPAPAAPLALAPVTAPKIEVPDEACRQRLSGWVSLEFAVLPDGKVADAHVLDADPKGTFDAAALAAVNARTYPPQAAPVKAHERLPINFADCRVEQLRAAAPAEGPPPAQDDCPTIAQQAQALGEQISELESGRGVLDKTEAQVYSAPSEHCYIAGKTLKHGGKLVSHLEYKGFSLVSRPKDKPAASVWVRSNTLKDLD